ncbi:glucokinase [Balnearium lithotrophicum]|uniref:Glucokinase n=1 Tax=Balnearium lithotrophicum TaxID=223788 RepID=A0A521BP51_9BACT|nr:ROK family protein [Balnearium lithotrophicum]SMO48924.1 glucokinase [Balnearium lithotrophicum]
MRLGVDVGGTFVKFTDGENRWKERTPKTKEDLVSLISSVGKSLNVKSIGVAVAGLVNTKKGTVTESPNLKFLNGFPLKEELEKKLNVQVSIFNDATAAAYGEYKLGVGRGSSVFLCLTLGTGLGGGAVIEGAPLFGVSGTAMEVGHITVEVNGWPCHCGRKGCLEAYVSSYGLERFYFMETGECASSFEVIERAKNRETEALKSIDEMSDYLTVGIASLIHLFNPDVVAISGGIPASYPELLKTTEQKVKKRAFKQPASDFSLKLAELGEFSGAFGALLLTMYNSS